MAALLHPTSASDIMITVDFTKLPYDPLRHVYTYKLPTVLNFDINEHWSFYVHNFIFPTYFENLQDCSLTIRTEQPQDPS